MYKNNTIHLCNIFFKKVLTKPDLHGIIYTTKQNNDRQQKSGKQKPNLQKVNKIDIDKLNSMVYNKIIENNKDRYQSD
jgi:hypothetical protein